jgi:hypothetical protein
VRERHDRDVRPRRLADQLAGARGPRDDRDPRVLEQPREPGAQQRGVRGDDGAKLGHVLSDVASRTRIPGRVPNWLA